MSNQLITAVFGLVLGVVLAVFFLKKRKMEEKNVESMLQDKFDKFQQQVEYKLDTSKQFLNERVTATERTARELSQHFGHLREAYQAIIRTNTDILDFQKMLSSPSARGGFGELLLETLLRDILPTDRYALQYTLRSGERADAVIKLQDGYVVAVDAKFPLAGYEPLVRAEDETERQSALRNFASDVKKHARDISSKYISASDNTLSFAFMYIPSEGVYYEIARNPELWNAITSLKVYPVSPSSLVPYLYTILAGLRGMRIEKQTRHILELLGKIQKDFNKVDSEFLKVGSHLEQALHRHEDAVKTFGRLKGKVENLGAAEVEGVLETGEIKLEEELPVN